MLETLIGILPSGPLCQKKSRTCSSLLFGTLCLLNLLSRFLFPFSLVFFRHHHVHSTRNTNIQMQVRAGDVDTSPHVRLVVVEGNISAGKSTLCRSLADELGYELFLEPMITNPYIERYYADPVKYGLAMQLWLLRQRFIMYCRALRALTSSRDNNGNAKSTSLVKGVVLDRSLLSDIVFADKNLADGNISKEGYVAYSELRQHLLSLVPAPDAVVYLDCPAAVCHSRIHGLRKRDCEAGIPLEYLQGLEDCYEAFLEDLGQPDAADNTMCISKEHKKKNDGKEEKEKCKKSVSRMNRNPAVLRVDWASFGDPASVASAVKALSSPSAKFSPSSDMAGQSFSCFFDALSTGNTKLKTEAQQLLRMVATDQSALAALTDDGEYDSVESTCHYGRNFPVLQGLAPPDLSGAAETLREELQVNASEKDNHGRDLEKKTNLWLKGTATKENEELIGRKITALGRPEDAIDVSSPVK